MQIKAMRTLGRQAAVLVLLACLPLFVPPRSLTPGFHAPESLAGSFRARAAHASDAQLPIGE
jgi:hypothetical protein